MSDHTCTFIEYGSIWQIWCETCGRVGGDEPFFEDARCIADRHEEIGGFER